MRETAQDYGVDAYIIDDVKEFDVSWLVGKQRLGITSGASVPKIIVDELVDVVQTFCPATVLHRSEDIESGIKFPIPNF